MGEHRIINEHTILKNTDTTPYLSFPALEQFDFIRHGFSTRLGGVSSGIYESMNLGFNRGDDDALVRENYERICNSIGIHAKDLVFTDQVHKDNVRVATKEDCGKGIEKERDYSEIDGHITNEKDVPLLAFAADCVPVFFVDPMKKAIGITHSGWKGTAMKIGRKTVEKMTETYGSKPQDMVAVIGPCIGKECYEVSEEVAEAFRANFTETQLSTFLEQTSPVKYHLDLWNANREILLEAGLSPEHITISGLCTMCHPTLLFSHRHTKGQRGSMAGFICLK